MRKISIGFEVPKIEINGMVFVVLKSDKAIVEDMIAIDKQFDGRDFSDNSVVIEKNNVMLAYIDQLFGKGATEKIIASVPGLKEYGLGLGGLDGFLGKIVNEAGKAYVNSITVKYDD